MIANVEEPAVEVIDAEMAKLGGEVTRRPAAEVMGELEAAEEAAEAAAREARRTLREKRKAEVHAGCRRARGQAEGEAPRLLTRAPPAGGRSPPTERSAGFVVSREPRQRGSAGGVDGSLTRSALCRMTNRSGGVRSTASPSTPA